MQFSWLATHLEIVLISLVVLIAASFMLQQRRSPQSTAAWLLALIVMPYVAVPIFVAVGFRKRHDGPEAIDFRPINSGDPVDPLDALWRSYGLPPAVGGHRLQLHVTPQEARTALFSAVTQARRRIDALFYIVANDAQGRAFVEALTEKAREGLAVRLLIDRLGTLFPPTASLRDFQEAGGTLEYFSPLVQRPRRGHLNLRNHRKMLIVDDERVLSGGMNIGEEYLGQGAWVDLAFTLEGPAVRSYSDVFESDWSGLGGTEASHPATARTGDDCVAHLIPSGPDLPHDGFHDGLVNAIHRAERRIWIATPYFLPTDGLSEALSIAARRGIDVRVMLPRRSNQRVADFARGAYLRELSTSGARIELFGPGMMHAKMGLIDDTGYLGSTNFDVRSMLLNFETALAVHDPASLAALERWYEGHAGSCTDDLAQAGTLRRIAEGLFRIGAPML